MVAYSFQRRFIEPILAGTKVGTIRALSTSPSRHARPDSVLQLYYGMRTRHCRLIATAICRSVDPIRLQFAGEPQVIVGDPRAARDGPNPPLVFDVKDSRDAFAQGDGFEDWAALAEFWRTTHRDQATFDGLWIRWRDVEPPRSVT